MLINAFHGKQDHTFTKIYKFYNGITTRVLINNGRFTVVWRSQCNVDQKRERREPPVKIASDIYPYAERFGCKKNSLLFALHLQCFYDLKNKF